MNIRLIIAILLCATVAYAQPSTTVGSVRGQLVDRATAQPAAGAVVIATSSALQGEQTAISDERGAYFISALPPGLYQLTIYYLDGKFARGNVLVQLGKQAVVNITIDTAEAGTGEVIAVRGDAPLIDQGSTKIGITLTDDYTRNVPTQRTFGEVVGAAAGAQGDLYGVSIAGTTSPETSYIVNGVVVTDPVFATLSTQLPNEFIAGTEIITGGYGAEYGRATGGIVNVITKQGSNEVHGSVFAHYTPHALVASARTIQREGSAIYARNELDNSYDLGAEIGGPIVRDRVWFHAGFAPHVTRETTTRIIASQVDADQDGVVDIDPDTGFTVHDPIASTLLPWHTTTYYFTAKLTGAVDEHHRGELAAFGNPTTADEGAPVSITRAPSSLPWQRKYGSYNFVANWTSKFRDGATEVNALAGFHRTYDLPHGYADQPTITYLGERSLYDFADVEPSNIDACNDQGPADPYPNIVNCPILNYAAQGTGFVGRRTDDHRSIALTLTHRAKLAGYHVLQLGVQFDQADDASWYHFPGGFSLARGATSRAGAPGVWRLNQMMRVTRNLTDEERADPDGVALGPDEILCPDRPAVCAVADPLRTTVHDSNIGTYIQDSWLITRSLTISAGLRWDHQSGHADEDVVGTLTPEGEAISERVFTIDDVAPRVGVVHDPTGEGRAKLFAHYGRFYETLPLTASNLFQNGFGVQTRLNVSRTLPNRPGYDPNCNVDHGTPELVATILACSDRGAPVPQQFFAFVAPGLKGQYTDEVVTGVEYEVVPDLKLGATYQWRTVPVVIDDMSLDNGNTLFVANPGENFDAEAAKLRARAEQLMTSSDPDDQALAALYTSRARSLEEIKYFDKPKRNYDALQLTANLRPTERSLLIGSYTYSRNRGNYPGLFSPETGQLVPNLNAIYDLPSLLANRDGVLGLDRPHNLRADAFYRFDLDVASALTVGSSLRVQSGVAYTALAAHPTYGVGESYLLPAGALGRTPVTAQLDAHFAFALRLQKRSAFEAFLDVFNLFNAQGDTRVDQRYTRDAANPIVNGTLDDLRHLKAIDIETGQELNRSVVRNPNFGNATAAQQPRVVQLGMRWLF